YDASGEPAAAQPYTISAESRDRSGYARVTLAPREGMEAPVPELRSRPTRSMKDMGMNMAAMDMGGMKMNNNDMKGMDHGKMHHGKMNMDKKKGNKGMDMIPEMEGPIARHKRIEHGKAAACIAEYPYYRMDRPG